MTYFLHDPIPKIYVRHVNWNDQYFIEYLFPNVFHVYSHVRYPFFPEFRSKDFYIK